MGRCGDQCGCWWVGGREFCVIPVSYRSGLERREGFGVFFGVGCAMAVPPGIEKVR